MTRAQYTETTLTAMEQFKLLPEGIRAEVINDVLYILASPTPYHQEVILNLLVDLTLYVRENKLGKVYPGPTDVFSIDEKNVVIPDINFITNENIHIIDKKNIKGAPDLLIEVHSPSTGKRDRTIKKELYERMGVREYWMVHPLTKRTEGYLLENGKYSEPLQLESQIQIRILNLTLPF